MICDPSACNQSNRTFFRSTEKPKIIQNANFFFQFFLLATQIHLSTLPVYRSVKKNFKDVIQKKIWAQIAGISTACHVKS